MEQTQILKLNSILARQGKTKKQFASELNISRYTLYDLLSGKIKGSLEGSQTWKAKRRIQEVIAEAG